METAPTFYLIILQCSSFTLAVPKLSHPYGTKADYHFNYTAQLTKGVIL